MSQNNLYPVFLKIENLHMLIIGGGNVGFEKLLFVLKSSPAANVTLVAREIKTDIFNLVQETKSNVLLLQKDYHENDLVGKNIVTVAVDDDELDRKVRTDCKKRNILINVADKPALCDFYLGSIVTRGDLKIAISTNGLSPTFAKRVRQFLEELLPENTASLIKNLNSIRNRLQDSFSQKVDKLNEITAGLLK